jgi:polar amino acid transport system substrate-binding protein
VSSRISTSRLLVVIACCLTLAVVFAACGSDSDSSTNGSSTAPAASGGSADPAVARLVPDAVKSRGTLTIAMDPSYAPNEFIDEDGKTVIGMDVDLANALAEVMGLKVKIATSTFDSLIPGLAAGKYDLGMSSFTDTREREQTVDFVTYLTAGTAFFTRTDGGVDIAGLAELCGHSVAVEKGTIQQDDAEAQDARCRPGRASGAAGASLLRT